MVTSNEGTGLAHFPERLERLFVEASRRGRTLSNEKVAKAVSDSGVLVTGSYLSQLRAGKRNNPSARLVAAIAYVFEVPVTYFFDTGRSTGADELEVLLAHCSPEQKRLIEMSAGLSDVALTGVAAVLDQMRLMEGLDEV